MSFIKALSSQNDIVQIESDSSVDATANATTTSHGQVPETPHVATETVEVGCLAPTNDGQRRRLASGENTASSSTRRRSSVSASAVDLFNKLMCLRRQAKLTDDVITTV